MVMTGILMKYSQIYNKNPEFQLPESSQSPLTGNGAALFPALENPGTITSLHPSCNHSADVLSNLRVLRAISHI